MDRDMQGPQYAQYHEFGTKPKTKTLQVKIHLDFRKFNIAAAQFQKFALVLKGVFLYPEQIQIERDEQRQTEVEEILQCIEEGPTQARAC